MTKKKLERQIQQLRIKDGDVIMVRKWPGFTDEDQKLLVESLKKRISRLDGVVVVFVKSLGDIRTLDEKQMAAHGWARMPRE